MPLTSETRLKLTNIYHSISIEHIRNPNQCIIILTFNAKAEVFLESPLEIDQTSSTKLFFVSPSSRVK